MNERERQLTTALSMIERALSGATSEMSQADLMEHILAARQMVRTVLEMPLLDQRDAR